MVNVGFQDGLGINKKPVLTPALSSEERERMLPPRSRVARREWVWGIRLLGNVPGGSPLLRGEGRGEGELLFIPPPSSGVHGKGGLLHFSATSFGMATSRRRFVQVALARLPVGIFWPSPIVQQAVGLLGRTSSRNLSRLVTVSPQPIVQPTGGDFP
jgi:hypothetical protein